MLRAGTPVVPIDPRTVRTILVVKLRAIGDVLLSTIVLPNLRRAFPAARIDFLTEPAAQDIVRRQPAIDEVLCYDRKAESGPGLVWRVRSRSYDMVIDLFGNPRTALLTFLSGARHRVGYRFRGRAYAYTVVVEPRGGEVHNTQFNLDALEAIGVEIVERNLYFPVAPEEVRFADDVLAAEGLSSGLRVALHTGGGGIRNAGLSSGSPRWRTFSWKSMGPALSFRGVPGSEAMWRRFSAPCTVRR